MTQNDLDFAKLFDVHDYEDDQPIKTQIVALIKTDEQGHPEIRFFTYVKGLFAEMGLSFGPEEGQEDKWEETEAWRQALEAFGNISENEAEDARNQLVEILEKQQEE